MLVSVEGLSKTFSAGILKKRKKIAVEGVSFGLEPGRTLGLVGESGSGKSTIARLMVGLVAPTAGKIFFQGQDITHRNKALRKSLATGLQIIFQHPESALNPRMNIYDSLVEPLRLRKLTPRGEAETARAEELLHLVGLNTEHMSRYPHELSGGQIQRVVLARILSLTPQCIIADEATSMLDVSVQAQVLHLFKQIQQELGIAFLFISHELDLVHWMSDEVVVLYQGHMVEKGPAADVYHRPLHPYTQNLVDVYQGAIQETDLSQEDRIFGDEAIGTGCTYYHRCPQAYPKCRQRPLLMEGAPGHYVACRRVLN